MRYTLTITEQQYAQLGAIVFADPVREGAAYLLCGRSVDDGETRFLVRDVVPVAAEHYLVRERDRLSIASPSYAAVAKRAGERGDALVFVHSHPGEIPDFSAQDDREEQTLMEFFAGRIPDWVHGGLVLPQNGRPRGRVWTPGGYQRMERVRVLGTRFRFFDEIRDEEPIPEFFDRQVRAFGPDIQRLLRRLHVGVVGAGGTGSAIMEQLTRLGVGTISLFDRECFEKSNVNRVYGSGVKDDGHPKVEISAREVEHIGVGTVLYVHPKHITDREMARRLRTCDLVFGCTDNEAPRGILVRLALWYLVPVIDMAVAVTSKELVIRSVDGRVTTLIPGEACLFCRERITPEEITRESLSPEKRQDLVRRGYAPELGEAAPAVIPFTTMVAAQAVCELLHRLTGFMGEERVSSETLLLFDQLQIRTNRREPKPDCLCMQKSHWGEGDRRRFLDLNWA